MANYAQSLYGSALYGPNATSADLVTNLTSTVLGYGSIHLSWTNPGSSWIRMRLVRSQYGFPMTQDGGVVLFDVNAGPAATAPLDAAVSDYTDHMLAAPRFYYYSIFVSKVIGASIQWVKSGSIIGQSVQDHGYTSYLLNRLPGIYSTADSAVEELAGTQSTPLSRYLGIVGMDIARARDFYDHLTASWAPEHIHVNLLPELLATYNYAFEPMVGIRNNRSYAASAPLISQMKGTSASVVALGKAITGYQVKQSAFVNLMLDDNDSSFEQSLGRWQINTGSATILQVGTPTRNDGTNPALGAMQVTSTANTNNIDLSPADSGYGFGGGTYGGGEYGVGVASTAVKFGVPVQVGNTYTVSAYVYAAVNSTQPVLDIQWFDGAGAFIATSSGVALATANANYNARPSTTDIAPGGAAYAIPHLRFVGVSSGDVFYVDQVQFEQAASPGTYTPARQITVRLIAPRINELPNPGFDTDVSNWTTSNSTLTWDSTQTYNGGAGAAKVVPAGSGSTGLGNLVAVIVDPAVPYVVAAQVFSATTQTYQLGISFFDKTNALIRTDSVANLTVAANAWARVAVLGNVVPATASFASIVLLATPGTGNTAATFWVDDFLFEEINLFQGDEYGGVPYGSGGYGGVLGLPNLIGDMTYGSGPFGSNSWGGADPPRYFDLRTDPVDAKWEGTAGASRLHLYPLFAIRESRLADLLTQTVPLGASSRVVWAIGRPS